MSGQVTLTGQGNFLGLAKVYNGCEIGAEGCVADPTAAPESITYDTEILEDGKMKVDILIQGTNAYWSFLMEKKPEERCGSAVELAERLKQLVEGV